jgi:hypothetical protein
MILVLSALGVLVGGVVLVFVYTTLAKAPR